MRVLFSVSLTTMSSQSRWVWASTDGMARVPTAYGRSEQGSRMLTRSAVSLLAPAKVIAELSSFQ